MAKSDPILEVDLGDNGKLIFRSHNEISEFLEREAKFWGWLVQAENQSHPTANHTRNQVAGEIQGLIQGAQNSRNQPHLLGGLKESFTRAFLHNRIPISTSKVGRFLSELKDEDGPFIAASAIAARLNHHPKIGDYRILRGAIEMIAFDLGINVQSGKAVQKELAALSKRYSDSLALSDKATDELLDEMGLAIGDQKEKSRVNAEYHTRLAKVMNRWTVHKIRMHKRVADRNLAKAVDEFKATEDVYKEFMRLKAPVDYWTDKAKVHSDNAKSRKRWLIGYAAVATFLVMLILVSAAIRAPAYITKDTPIFVIGLWGAIGLFSSTILFWAGRVMVRLYLSEHHLALDAEERKTMAMTYLALTNDGKIEEKDRSLVLAPLFRPTADGIVKDDAAPDVGLSSLISKAAAK